MDLTELRDVLRRFADDRAWAQYHSPKNLSMALASEVGELVAHFQWLTEDQSAQLATDELGKLPIADEIADVLIYLVRLADELHIDPVAAALEKTTRNEKRYPIEHARGNARKWTELASDQP